MAINHSTTISLYVLNNSKNIVSRVKVMLTSSDDSDPEATKITSDYYYCLDTSAGNSAPDFVLWSKLTESIVLSWKTNDGRVISDALNDTKTWQENQLSKTISPPPPIEIEKSIPW